MTQPLRLRRKSGGPVKMQQCWGNVLSACLARAGRVVVTMVPFLPLIASPSLPVATRTLTTT